MGHDTSLSSFAFFASFAIKTHLPMRSKIHRSFTVPSHRYDLLENLISLSGRCRIVRRPPLNHPVDLNDYAELGPAAAKLISLLGIGAHGTDTMIENLPFTHGDTTVGTENELQVAVLGSREDVDLPESIRSSDYFKNMLRRTATGDAPARMLADLEHFLTHNPDQVWENSWVRFPRRNLSTSADAIFEQDLKVDKKIRTVLNEGITLLSF